MNSFSGNTYQFVGREPPEVPVPMTQSANLVEHRFPIAIKLGPLLSIRQRLALITITGFDR